MHRIPRRDWPCRRLARPLHALPVLALFLASCGGPSHASAAFQIPSGAGIAPTPAAAPSPIKHVFLIVMENKEEGEVLGNPDAPYLNQLAEQYAVADQYYAVSHPSLPNYLVLIGGDTFGITNDCTDCFQDAPNLADSLEAKGLTWKSYQEDLPQPCYKGTDAGEYAMRHNPFLYFNDIRDDATRCTNVVPLPQFAQDMASERVPNFSFITPNVIHDMHDGSVADGDQWLANFVPTILTSAAYQDNGLLLIVWDEGSTSDGCCDGASGGKVPLLAIAPNGPAGYHATTPASHYSLLRTIENLWGLDHVGHSDDADVRALCDLMPQSVTCTP